MFISWLFLELFASFRSLLECLTFCSYASFLLLLSCSISLSEDDSEEDEELEEELPLNDLASSFFSQKLLINSNKSISTGFHCPPFREKKKMRLPSIIKHVLYKAH